MHRPLAQRNCKSPQPPRAVVLNGREGDFDAHNVDRVIADDGVVLCHDGVDDSNKEMRNLLQQ